ncbi:MAG: Excinuclease subunit [Verrucomicrobiales bacterium]|nr:Excinuclease subunit [Verrucomicrobiales bacterium]
MPAAQLRLLPAPKPLVEKLGREFFLSVPEKPGVYFFRDGNSRLLYVGKSSNLKKRLSSYRVASPERLSRKTIRLLHQVTSITWEELETPLGAELRENELLRTLRPKFNRMNVYPAASAFIFMCRTAGALELRVGREFVAEAKVFGAFSSSVFLLFGSLTRALWCLGQQKSSLDEIPRRLLLEKPHRHFAFEQAEGAELEKLELLLETFLGGEGTELLAWLKLRRETLNPPLFLNNLLLEDISRLEVFFISGPARNKSLQEHGADSVISRDSLGDFKIMERFHRTRTAEESPVKPVEGWSTP